MSKFHGLECLSTAWEAGAQDRNLGFLVLAVLCAFLPLEATHLASVLIGAAGYLLFQTFQPGVSRAEVSEKQPSKLSGPTLRRGPRPAAARTAAVPASRSGAAVLARGQQCRGPVQASLPLQAPRGLPLQAPPGLIIRSPRLPQPPRAPPSNHSVSVRPVEAPKFGAVGFDAEAKELINRIMPSPEGDVAVANIAALVKRMISPVFPDAEVTGFAHSNLSQGTAFSVAVPEVDIVVAISWSLLSRQLSGRWGQVNKQAGGGQLDTRKLQKAAIRACTDRLVSTGTCKFRRSAFRDGEPKVILVAPGPGDRQGIPVNLSVNASTPLHSAALVTESSRIDPRALELMLLVRRWAKDRGLCHSAKGHLPPYAWSLLAIFYLQVGSTNEHPRLPPLTELKTSLRSMWRNCQPAINMKATTAQPGIETEATSTSVGALFKDFVAFYAQRFDWDSEAVSVRLARHAAPDVCLPVHMVLNTDRTTQVAPSIEDPFNPSCNLGACMTAMSLEHFHQEFQRAHKLCSQDESLTCLLEPWAPPKASGPEYACDEQEHDFEG